MAAPRPRVAVLGAGRMGSAAAERLAQAGFEVIVWSRTREKALRAAEAAGGRAAGSVEEAVGQAEYAVSFLADDEAVMWVAARVPRSDGLVYLEMSTITPEAARAVAGHLESKGVCYVQAPVLGGPGRVREGRLIVLLAGRRQCKALASPLLQALAEHTVDLGEDYGAAAALKLAYNNLLLTAVAALSESLALAEAYGVGYEVFRDLLSRTVFSGLAARHLERVAHGRREPTFTTELAAKDLDYARRAAWRAGLAAPVASAAAEAYKLAALLGGAGDDYASAYYRRLLRPGEAKA